MLGGYTGENEEEFSGSLEERERVRSPPFRGYQPILNFLPVRSKTYRARLVTIQLLAGHLIRHFTDLHLLPHILIERFLPTDALALAADECDGVCGRAFEHSG